MTTLGIRFIEIFGKGLPEHKKFIVNDANWHLYETSGKSRVYICFTVGWNPRWRQFSNTPGLKVQPVRVAGLLLAGVQLVGKNVEAATRAIAALPANDSIALRAGTIEILRPIIQTVQAQL